MIPPSARSWTILAWAVLATCSAVIAASVGGATIGPATVAAQTGARVVNSNDYASIQAAIDDVNRTGGGAIYVPAGVHLLGQKILLYSNITLFGDGMDVTILRFRAGAVLDHMMSNESLSTRDGNIVVRDLTLSGPGPSTGKFFGLRLVNVHDSTVVNVASDNHGLDGFYLGYYNDQGANNIRLSGCRATNNGRNGISLTHGSGNIVDNCRVESNNRAENVAGIDLEPDQGLNVSGNKVVGNTARHQNVGVQLYSAERGQYVQGNNAVCTNTIRYNSAAGIWDYNGSQNVYVNNAVTDNGGINQVNFVVDGSAIFSGDSGRYCQLPSLPPAPPKPPSSTTPVPTGTATPTRTTTPGGATLSASPPTVGPGGTETVSWSGIPGPTATDWIGLYPLGADNAGFLDWKYVSCSQSPNTARASGSCDFTMRSTADSFEFRLFASDTYTRLATSNTVTVGAASTPTPTPTGATGTPSATPAPPSPTSGTATATLTPTPAGATATLSPTPAAATATPTRTATPSPGLPLAPTNLQAVARNNAIRLTWTPSTTPGVTYRVYRGTTPGGTKGRIADRVGGASFDDKNAQRGTTYSYQVTAVNGAGESAPSNEASATRPR